MSFVNHEEKRPQLAQLSTRQPSAQTKSSQTHALRSIIAGSVAGALEIVIKTRAQLNSRLPNQQRKPWPPFGRAWYVGCTTLTTGNAIKAGVRFVAFDHCQRLLVDSNGHLTPARTLLAGFGAGLLESLLAVTPFESIKTSLIQDRASPHPRMRGLLHGGSLIFHERGVAGFYQGFIPATARQAAGSAVRFGAYKTLKQALEGPAFVGRKLGAAGTFGVGAAAGLVSVYATQPLDVLKTRMQRADARTEYGGRVLRCARRVWSEEGVAAFWTGSTARAARLMVSGGIVFTMYEKIMEGFQWVDPDRKYF